ncbi:MAG: replication factor C small subunit [Gaeavirus sp.]|uniref:Replication factor C small subunit n=1 Tax=Gaeavirus sp. TaxID=2487767 RepID=A0A3G4ZZG7_9VIRU|nr:MAG: replication factor C small subunit [Gaeavirus sp.]
MNNLPFSEKYRPRKLVDLVLDKIIFNKINNIINTKDSPNIIFTGNPGVGKTSSIHCIARAIYSREEYQDSIMELNASDDRGIKSNEIIINFCKRKVYFKEGYAQHKLLILDEADNITPKAQRLINSIMEKYPTTRFAFICNNSTDIIESIQSRCVIIRFTKSPFTDFIKRIKHICTTESVPHDDDALKYLFDICQKDLRQTINTLELTYHTFGKVTISNINNICNIPSQALLDELFDSVVKKDVKNICTIINKFQTDGYYSLDVLLHFIQYIKNKKFETIPLASNLSELERDLLKSNNHELNNLEEVKIKLINSLSTYTYIMSKSTAYYIQLTRAFLSSI